MYRPDLGNIITSYYYQRVLEPYDADSVFMLASQTTFSFLSAVDRISGGQPPFITIDVLLPGSKEKKYRTNWQRAFIEPSSEVRLAWHSDKENVLASSRWMKGHGVEKGDWVYIRPRVSAPSLSLNVV